MRNTFPDQSAKETEVDVKEEMAKAGVLAI
jgi:hypothetical protein